MFDNLQERFDKAFKTLRGEGQITEVNVGETAKEIRRALIEADVSYAVAKSFAGRVKEKAIGREVMTSVKPGQLLVQITQEELTELMGGENQSLNIKGSPAVIVMSGLQGSGKTTHAAKLAKMLAAKGRRPLLVACDVYRPAAIDQLHVLGEQIDVDVYSNLELKDPVEIAREAVRHAKARAYDTVIVDTAGRTAVDEKMMAEIEAVVNAVNPSETLFVVDAMTGQDAVNTAKAFHERIAFNGVILTKMDGDTRGGAALSIREVTGVPVKFIGTGEKLDALELFHPNRMAERILGMGDVVSLVEKAQEHFDEDAAKKLEAKIRKNKFDLDDFLKQIQQIQKMGNVKDLLSMVPGMGKALKGVEIEDDAFKGLEAIIQSMTPDERRHPETLNGSRKQRVARGAGVDLTEVNKLLKQFNDLKKMMKTMSGMGGKGRRQMMGNLMGGAGGPGGPGAPGGMGGPGGMIGR
jgi:signal recognition particle subunit SRP54